MYPFFVLFGKTISMYAVMAVIGMLLAGFCFCKNVKKQGLDDNDAIIFLLFVGVGILIGGSVLFALTNLNKFHLLLEAQGFKDFFKTLSALFSGSVFYGGLIGGSLVGIIFIYTKKLPLAIYADCASFCIPLFHCLARIGCFLAGCCYGIESTFGFSATNNTISTIGTVRRFPVQLLESAVNLIIFLIIYNLYKGKKLQSKLFFVYLSLYSIARFFLEFLRGDEIRGFILGLSTSQFISVLIAISIITIFTVKKIKHKKTAK